MSINHWRGRAAKLASSAYSCWEWIGWFERVSSKAVDVLVLRHVATPQTAVSWTKNLAKCGENRIILLTRSYPGF